MKRVTTISILSLILIFCGSVWAQMPTGQWFAIHSEIVKPSMIKEYEVFAHKFVEMVKANQATMPHFYFVALQFEDLTYSYVLPVSNMGALDLVNQDFMDMMKSQAGPAFMENMMSGNAAVEYVRETVYGEAPELSYTPASPRLKPEEEMYFHYDRYFVKADKQMEAEALAKEFVELFKKKNIANGYKIYLAVMAPEMPVIVVRSGGKNEADFHENDAKDRELLGAEGKALFDRAFSLTRRFDQTSAWLRPDLSVFPPVK